MRQLLGIGVLLGLALTTIAAQKEDAAKKLNGTYKVFSVTVEGMKIDTKKDDVSFTFVDGKIKVKDGNRPEEVSEFKVDTTKSPPLIDITPEKQKNEAMYGIYEFKPSDDGAELSLYLAMSKELRPKDFKGEGMVMVLKMSRKKEK